MNTAPVHTSLVIHGMHCASCADKIQAAVRGITGVMDVSVSFQNGVARVTAREPIDTSAFKSAVSSAGAFEVTAVRNEESAPAPDAQAGGDTQEPQSLYPLFLIVGFLVGITLLIAQSTDTWALEPMMCHFMAGFFLVFAFFKLLDIPGFVSAYRGYDLIASKVPAWGWAYPFVELALGVAYLLALAPLATNAVTLVLMLVGAAGVLKALLDKRAIRCACLGTALNLPMTKVTLVEDLTMAAMAAVMLGMLLIA